MQKCIGRRKCIRKPKRALEPLEHLLVIWEKLRKSKIERVFYPYYNIVDISGATFWNEGIVTKVAFVLELVPPTSPNLLLKIMFGPFLMQHCIEQENSRGGIWVRYWSRAARWVVVLLLHLITIPSSCSFHMSPYESMWVHVSPCESIWVQMSPYESIWVHMTPYESIWLHTSTYESIWLHMSPYESIWLHMTPYESILIHTTPYDCIIGVRQQQRLHLITNPSLCSFHFSLAQLQINSEIGGCAPSKCSSSK